jgi:hypothetical protein
MRRSQLTYYFRAIERLSQALTGGDRCRSRTNLPHKSGIMTHDRTADQLVIPIPNSKLLCDRGRDEHGAWTGILVQFTEAAWVKSMVDEIRGLSIKGGCARSFTFHGDELVLMITDMADLTKVADDIDV